jgi:hypothetical protein
MALIEQCRGIESVDCNDQFVIVKAPIELVAPAFGQIWQATVWQQDVYDREIEIVGQDAIVFQFRGHAWTLIHELYGRKAEPNEQDAEALARQLDTEAIYYAVSDTGQHTRYRFYDGTGLIESLSFEGWNEPLQFDSKRRQFSPETSGEAYTFISRFMREQGIYIPMIFLPKVEFGQRLVLRIEANIHPSLTQFLKRVDFMRCDHVGIVITDLPIRVKQILP